MTANNDNLKATTEYFEFVFGEKLGVDWQEIKSGILDCVLIRMKHLVRVSE